MRRALAALACVLALAPVAAQAAAPARDWAAVAHLPDWSGVWTPDVIDQNRQVATNPPPWTAAVGQQVKALETREQAGRPKGLFVDCLPHGMPALMLVTHNALEFVFEPGRVLVLGESDGNRLRRIHTDGRPHPNDPDPSFFGHSIGRWEGDALVVDTVAIFPQTYLAVSEAVGIPNDGDLHVVEKIRLEGPDTLVDDLTITAPHILTRPWRTRRIYNRQRDPAAEIVEGVCLQGRFLEGQDADGHAAFTALPAGQDGAPAPPP
jgi:hypothetical protein